MFYTSIYLYLSVKFGQKLSKRARYLSIRKMTANICFVYLGRIVGPSRSCSKMCNIVELNDIVPYVGSFVAEAQIYTICSLFPTLMLPAGYLRLISRWLTEAVSI